jgi:Mce-associated membrane protein
MSPRRRYEPDARAFRLPDQPPRNRALTVVAAIAGAVMVVCVTVAALVFVKHETVHQAQIRDADVIGFVKSFVTNYTSPDPFNANAYADSVLANGTGRFAEDFEKNINAVVIQVARAERGFGAVQELGIERWNSDGSADVIAVAMMTTRMPDGKSVESSSRWVVTAAKEGEQWKVSNLIQVI